MKKSILFTCIVLASFSFTVFGYMNWGTGTTDFVEQSYNNTHNPENVFVNLFNKQVKPDFHYAVDSRFINTVTKENLQKAKSIHDIFSKGETKGIEAFRDVNIIILPRDAEKFAKGDGNELNSAQLSLLQTTDYATDICIEAFSKQKNLETGEIEEQYFVYYMSVVPEKKAEFKDGQLALLNYLKEHSQKETASLTKDKLEPGKVRFIVTKEGEIEHVSLEATSGYKKVDNKMLALIRSLPGEWEAATNSKGKKVDQKLVFSFGIVGC